MSTIANRLREFRAAVGLTQREVASICGLGKRTIIYWEMGDREIKCSKLIPLVDDYDLDFNWLILGRGTMFSEAELNGLNPEEIVEVPEEIETPAHIPPQWDEKPPETFKKEQEDVLPLIQRLRRK